MPAKRDRASCLEPTNKTIARGHQKKHHGISYSSCCRTIWSALLQSSSAALHTSPLWDVQELRSSSTAHSHSRQTATRSWGQSRACAECGRLVQLWPACRKVEALAFHLPTGWCTETQAQTFGAWTLPATATSQRWNTPTRRCAKTIRVDSASPSRTKSLQQHDHCTPHLSTTACSRTTLLWARALVLSTHCGSRTKASSQQKRSRSIAPMHLRTWAKNHAQYVSALAFPKLQTLPSTRSVAKVLPHGCSTSSPTHCQRSAEHRLPQCSTQKERSLASSLSHELARKSSSSSVRRPQKYTTPVGSLRTFQRTAQFASRHFRSRWLVSPLPAHAHATYCKN